MANVDTMVIHGRLHEAGKDGIFRRVPSGMDEARTERFVPEYRLEDGVPVQTDESKYFLDGDERHGVLKTDMGNEFLHWELLCGDISVFNPVRGHSVSIDFNDHWREAIGRKYIEEVRPLEEKAMEMATHGTWYPCFWKDGTGRSPMTALGGHVFDHVAVDEAHAISFERWEELTDRMRDQEERWFRDATLSDTEAAGVISRAIKDAELSGADVCMFDYEHGGFSLSMSEVSAIPKAKPRVRHTSVREPREILEVGMGITETSKELGV